MADIVVRPLYWPTHVLYRSPFPLEEREGRGRPDRCVARWLASRRPRVRGSGAGHVPKRRTAIAPNFRRAEFIV